MIKVINSKTRGALDRRIDELKANGWRIVSIEEIERDGRVTGYSAAVEKRDTPKKVTGLFPTDAQDEADELFCRRYGGEEVKQWHRNFDERQQALIRDCGRYSTGDAAGLPGHNLVLIVAKFSDMMDTMEELIIDLGSEPKFKRAMAAFRDPQPKAEQDCTDDARQAVTAWLERTKE